MEKKKSLFETLYAVDTTDKVKTKQNLKYLSWSSALAEVKKIYPDVKVEVMKQKITETITTEGKSVLTEYDRPWFTDGNSGWVVVQVTIDEQTQEETLAIMDFKNKAMQANLITSVDANKAIKRCMVKALAMMGLAMHIYEGEDLPEEASKVQDLLAKIESLIQTKAKVCGGEKVKALCVNAEKEANLNVDEYTGRNYKEITDVEVLEKLQRGLMALRAEKKKGDN